ncbi:P-loop containing nucleoside triphosphate hydrolase protein [Pelagophyceae sp. CCMP2097]|nr:P-loop containing nucleoside triphosphate hydrolase protein [Pelagophyceae sp. CCMP2097]
MPSDSEDDEVKGPKDQRQFKVILLGDGAVGKTSIASRFANDAFSQSYKQTIGLDFFIKHVVLPGDVHVALQLWDIGGQSISSKMIHNYIFGAHAVLLCYDITNYDSFANLEDWYRVVRATFKNDDMPFVGIIANKCDMSHLRAVKSDVHNRFADENSCFSFMMSAKSGDQVKSCFLRVASVLADVRFTRPELEVEAQTVVKATIIEHTQHDTAVHEGQVPEYASKKKDGKCVVC